MKKIFLLLTVFSMVFTSCNPLEDIHEEIGAKESIISGEASYTLNDEDYKTLELSYGNFSSIDDAKTALPAFLSDKYPAWGKGSLAAVTFKLYSPIKFEAYTVTDADYTALGLTSLNDSGDYNDFFDQKFPSEEKGTVIDLTFKTDPVLIDYSLTDEDYDLVGNGRFDNFDIRSGRAEEDPEVRRGKIQTILLNNFPDAAFGTKYKVTYEAYDGSGNVDLDLSVQLEENPTDPAKTTTFMLADADYALIGNGTFNNFDIRDTSPEADEDVRRGKIQTILLNNYPSAVSGDFFVVSYDTYDGFGRPVLTMILQFDGTNYNIFDVKKYALYEFALEDATMRFTLADDWTAPITFTNAEYTLMGERFPNFSDKDDAVYKIGIYLRTLYQFAAPDDFVAVEYKYYNGSTTGNENVNFVFDGTVWNAIPTVIDETIKFGHDGASWVPDNTIKYAFTTADYDSLGTDFGFPGYYNNYDVRVGNDNYVSPEEILADINIILMSNFPGMVEGQKFVVSYDVYSGAAEVWQMEVVLTEGVYVLQ